MNVTKKIHKLAIITITIIKKLNSPFEIFNSFDDSSIIFNSLLSFSVRVKNKKIFEEEVQSSVDLGFDGKLAINPKHIESINKAFNSYEIELIKNIIKIYEKEAKAVAVIDGKVYEKMHIDRLKRILKENEEK